jgi:hypothetical protein
MRHCQWPTSLYPELAKQLDRFSLVRSLEAWDSVHARAQYVDTTVGLSAFSMEDADRKEFMRRWELLKNFDERLRNDSSLAAKAYRDYHNYYEGAVSMMSDARAAQVFKIDPAPTANATARRVSVTGASLRAIWSRRMPVLISSSSITSTGTITGGSITRTVITVCPKSSIRRLRRFSRIWLHADAPMADPCSTKHWSFAWASSDERPEISTFSGGAIIISMRLPVCLQVAA